MHPARRNTSSANVPAMLCSALLLPLALATTPLPTGLTVQDVRAVRADDQHAVELTLGWANAWRNERNHDAVWLVLRDARDATRGPLRIAPKGHRTLDGEPNARFAVADDATGVFVSSAEAHRGDVQWRLSIALDEEAPEDVDAWAVEMVFVPAGGFELGDTHPMSLQFSAFFAAGEDGTPAGRFTVESEEPIEVGAKPGQLYYKAGRVPQYRGDQQGPIPAAFPKGTRAFYMMKYELTQGEYAAFVGALPAAWRARRAATEHEEEERETFTVSFDSDEVTAAVPTRPCNFVSWDDTCAFADWMALRPMTELEFEKASRGTESAPPRDFPWGTASFERLERTVQRPTRDLERATAEDERALDDATKDVLGASFYWVMDLSGSMWERVVTAGHPAGRAFTGSHGDGVLDAETGDATNADWPRGSADGREADGVGYRGGAEYFGPRKPDNLTNPESPVAFRTYAAWNGAYAYKTYSARAVRTAPASAH